MFALYNFYMGIARRSDEKHDMALRVWGKLNAQFGGARSAEDEFTATTMMHVALDARAAALEYRNRAINAAFREQYPGIGQTN